MSKLTPMILLSVLLASCGGNDNKKDDRNAPVEKHIAIISDIIFTDATKLESFSESLDTYTLDTLNYRKPMEMTIKSPEDGYAEINGEIYPVNEAVSLNKLTKGNTAIVVKGRKSSGDWAQYNISAFPSDFPKYKIYGEPSIDGEILLAPRGKSNYVLDIATNGDLIFYKRLSSTGFDFKKTTIGNKIRYSYMEGTAVLQGVGYAEGSIAILDENFVEIDRVSGLLPNLAKGRTDIVRPEAHDYIVLDDHHYILSGYYAKSVNNIPGYEGSDVSVVASLIQEQKDGNIVFEWDSTEHLDLYNQAEEQNDYAVITPSRPWKDYVHFNSMYIDSFDNNLVFSFRNLNSVKKISRSTGDEIWSLGGKSDDFALSPQQMMQGQHTARFDMNHNLVIFDNNTFAGGVAPIIPRFDEYKNAGTRNVAATRIVSYQLDEANKKLLGYSEFYVPSFGRTDSRNHFTSFTGSVQTLPNGNYLIGWGSHNLDDSEVTEIDIITGAVVFDLVFEYDDETKATKPSSYRAYLYPNK